LIKLIVNFRSCTIFVLCCTDNLGLTEPDYFFYLNQSGTYQVDGTDDSKEFEATMVGNGLF